MGTVLCVLRRMYNTVGGRKSLHDDSLKTVKICVHCTQIFTLCKDLLKVTLRCKDLRTCNFSSHFLSFSLSLTHKNTLIIAF